MSAILTETAAPPSDPLSGRDMLCFSHDWTGDPLSKTHLMRILARDNRILWVNSIGYRAPKLTAKRDLGRLFRKLKMAAEPLREVEPNIFVLNPLVAPPYDHSWVRSFNRFALRAQIRRAMKRLNFHDPINWVFNPAAGMIAGELGESMVLYYCVDEYTAFTGVDSKNLGLVEERLLKRADLVVVSADRLLESKGPSNPNTILVRHGVDVAHFRKALDASTVVPSDLADMPKPVVGFFGLVADWVDVAAMAQAARELPHVSFAVIGSVTTDVSELKSLPNVRFLGRKPYSELPAYCKGFDVAINPFIINELTLNANPLKVREYLAAGLPVVSSAVPEVEALGGCLIARTTDEFIEKVREALRQPGPNAERSASMNSESWEARLDAVGVALRGVKPRSNP